MNEAPYDSTGDTLTHIRSVQTNIVDLCWKMHLRALRHDRSKLEPMEKEAFDRMTPRLAGATYGSEEYKAMLAELGPSLQNHYRENTHHPEHWPNGIEDMSLLDIVEMFCDWEAACRRHNNGSLEKSVEHNAVRFQTGEVLRKIFQNTRKEMGWNP